MFRVEQRTTMLADDEKNMQPSRLRPDKKMGKLKKKKKKRG